MLDVCYIPVDCKVIDLSIKLRIFLTIDVMSSFKFCACLKSGCSAGITKSIIDCASWPIRLDDVSASFCSSRLTMLFSVTTSLSLPLSLPVPASCSQSVAAIFLTESVEDNLLRFRYRRIRKQYLINHSQVSGFANSELFFTWNLIVWCILNHFNQLTLEICLISPSTSELEHFPCRNLQEFAPVLVCFCCCSSWVEHIADHNPVRNMLNCILPSHRWDGLHWRSLFVFYYWVFRW